MNMAKVNSKGSVLTSNLLFAFIIVSSGSYLILCSDRCQIKTFSNKWLCHTVYFFFFIFVNYVGFALIHCSSCGSGFL